MLRLVTGTDGRILADPAGSQAGRGAYVCRTSVCIKGLAKVRMSRWNRLFRREDIAIAPKGMPFEEQSMR